MHDVRYIHPQGLVEKLNRLLTHEDRLTLGEPHDRTPSKFPKWGYAITSSRKYTLRQDTERSLGLQDDRNIGYVFVQQLLNENDNETIYAESIFLRTKTPLIFRNGYMLPRATIKMLVSMDGYEPRTCIRVDHRRGFLHWQRTQFPLILDDWFLTPEAQNIFRSQPAY